MGGGGGTGGGSGRGRGKTARSGNGCGGVEQWEKECWPQHPIEEERRGGEVCTSTEAQTHIFHNADPSAGSHSHPTVSNLGGDGPYILTEDLGPEVGRHGASRCLRAAMLLVNARRVCRCKVHAAHL